MSQGPKQTLILTDEEEQALVNAESIDLTGLEADVKEAQKRVGELMWLMSRTRPDIQYVVALMASTVTRSPQMVNKIGQRLLDYLNETIGYRIKLNGYEDADGGMLNVFTDSSFAPSGGRSHGASAVFLGNSPLTWRSSRQPLVTLSTAESELIEGIEGTLLAMFTRGVLQELLGHPLVINLHVDNQAAVTLLTASSGSWRTRHLKLRSHWMKERVRTEEVRVLHVPGVEQKADLGTKPFTRARLAELVGLWNIVERSSTSTTSSKKAVKADASLLRKLLLLCQVCGVKAMKEDIVTEIPWDLYVAVMVLAIAVIGLWHGMKACSRMRTAKLRALRAKATREAKLSKAELKELQRLLSTKPTDLSSEQMKRMLELKEKFERTMPPCTSPMPTSTTAPDIPLGTSSSSSSYNKQPKPNEKVMCDKETPADYVPAFERVQPPPPPEVRMYEGPFTMTQGGDKVHLFENCWGLRHASRTTRVSLCRCCAENGGRNTYPTGFR